MYAKSVGINWVILMENNTIENGFIVDLSNAKNTSQLIYELSSILDLPEARNKKICLKLGETDLNQSQLLSIKALIDSMQGEIGLIDTTSEITKIAAEALSITVSELRSEIEAEPEQTATQEEINTALGITEGTTFSQETIAEEISKDIVPLTPIADFSEVAEAGGLILNEDSKYVMMDTTGILSDEQKNHEENPETLPTLYINRTLRSGQTITYDGNIFIVGDAHPGSELVAKGDITVWGILGGIAHAGAQGNVNAKVRALKLNAIQLRIAGLYARRNDTYNVPYFQKSSEFTPEVAVLENNSIVIYKKLRRDE